MLRPLFLTISIFFLIVSCKDNETNSTNKKTKNDSETVETDKTIETSVKDDSLFFYKKELKKIKSTTTSVRIKNNKLTKENTELKQKLDSIETVISTIKTDLTNANDKIAKIKNDNHTDKRIVSLINNLLQSWDNLPTTGKTSTVTKYFAKKYRCNRISIDHDNTAQISWHTEKDFNDYLKSITTNKTWTFKTTNLKILDTEIKDNLYFNTSFKYSLDTFDDGKLVDKSNFLVTITGKKINNEFKIVIYSWVRFSYM
jgi:hypothetical protein